jgi:hypothetical protein
MSSCPGPEAVVQQLSALINSYRGAETWATANSDGRLGEEQARLFLTRACAAIERAAPPEGPYATEARAVLDAEGWVGWRAGQLIAIVEALRDDYAAGAMATVAELIHADLFGDLMDMAGELIEKRFIGPAAVVAGSVLEEHLRKLSTKYSIGLVDAKGRPKTVELLGVELRTAGAFSKVQRKGIQAWYAQRTEAAHGRFDVLIESEVERMIDSIRDFVARHAA